MKLYYLIRKTKNRCVKGNNLLAVKNEKVRVWKNPMKIKTELVIKELETICLYLFINSCCYVEDEKPLRWNISGAAGNRTLVQRR